MHRWMFAIAIVACGPGPRPTVADLGSIGDVRWIVDALGVPPPALATDADGDIVVASAADRSVTIVKRSGIDGTLVWSRSIVPTTGDSNAEMPHVAIDPVGNISVTGLYGGAVDFGGVIRTASFSAFVVKYNPDGQLLWASDVGPDSHACGLGISAGPSGQTIVVGNCSEGTLVAGGAPVPCNGSFVASIDPDGWPRWAFAFDSSGPVAPPSVAVGPDGDVVLAAVGSVGSPGTRDIGFVARFDIGGALSWLVSTAPERPSA